MWVRNSSCLVPQIRMEQFADRNTNSVTELRIHEADFVEFRRL
jgi:hypothetical protein